MGMFVGNSFIKTEDVRSKYREIDYYDLSNNDNTDIEGYVILKDDYENRIGEIEQDINSIIKTLENYDLSTAIDELKILAEKLY